MKISVFGLGYVGCVTAACFANLGNKVIGYDLNQTKVETIKKGKAPIEEKGLDEMLQKAINKGDIEVVTDLSYAIKNSEIGFVCVGTPASPDGSLNTSAVEKICGDVAEELKNKGDTGFIICIRSSVVPGTINKIRDILRNKDLNEGKDFFLVSNPEFMREGSGIKDFMHPPHVVIGADNEESANKVASLYEHIKAPIYKVSIGAAEIIKFVNNSWHALKLSFINEISSISKKLGIDSKELIELFCSDTKLNLGAYYFKPSIGYGGGCLPKDLAALQHTAKELEINSALLNSVSLSNIEQIKRTLDFVKEEAEKTNEKSIGIYGIAFKPDTDDIRGSPIIYLIDRLIAEGYDVRCYDPLIKKEQIDNIRNSYRDTIYDPLLSPLLKQNNFKNLVGIIEMHLFPLEKILECKIIVANAKMPHKVLERLGKDKFILDIQGLISQDSLRNTKARYLRMW